MAHELEPFVDSLLLLLGGLLLLLGRTVRAGGLARCSAGPGTGGLGEVNAAIWGLTRSWFDQLGAFVGAPHGGHCLVHIGSVGGHLSVNLNNLQNLLG